MNIRIGLGLVLSLAIATATLVVTGCAGNRYKQSTGEYIDDKATTARVKSALGDNKEFKLDGVDVTTFKGTVQLSGFVNANDQKKKAEEIAKTVEGVREVVNNITVKE